MIIRNAAKCNRCYSVIQSTHRHDFVECKCGSIFVDGGNEYIRFGGDGDKIIPLHISADKTYIPFSVQLENSQLTIAAHHPETCAGQVCPLHKRTDHEMRGWTQSVEMVGKTFITSRICPHGVTHTDPDDFYVYDISRCKKCSPRLKQVVF